MARGATVFTFEIALSDVDRGVYEALSLKVAQHPSESDVYMVTRVLAYALEFEEGIAFSPGLGTATDPALWVHDLTGQITAWIEIGTPEPARLHKASKAADRVAVYCHKEPTSWLESLAAARMHESDRIALFLLPREKIQEIAQGLERRNAWSLSRMEQTLYLETEKRTHELTLSRHHL